LRRNTKVEGGPLVLHFFPSAKPLLHTLAFSWCCCFPAHPGTHLGIQGLEAPTPAMDKMIFLVDKKKTEKDEQGKNTLFHPTSISRNKQI